MNPSLKKAIAYINQHSLTGIKAGLERPGFLDIWMVVVEGRIFARSWGFAERSWYNTFLQDKRGEIQCGEEIFQIEASIPEDLDALTEKINAAYLAKYDKGEKAVYAHGIIRPQHVEKTMEFVVIE